MAYADVSLASTSVTNPVFGANTNFYFDSWVSGSGTNDQSARNSESATAALGNAASQTGGPVAQPTGPATPAFSFASIPPSVLWIAGGGFLALIAVIYFTRK